MSKRKSDITAKIAALIIAIILWSYVIDSKDPVIEVPVRNVVVTLSNTSALERQNLEIMEPLEVTVNVRVSGKKSELASNKFSARNIVASVDLSGYAEGQTKVPVTVGLKNHGPSIDVVSWEPREILFTFDKRITKEKEVIIKTKGVLPEGYVLGELTTKSPFILLKGPRTWVNEVAEVIAEVDISGRTTTDSVNIPLKILSDTGNDVRGVDREPSSIDINIPVYRKVSLPIELQTVNELPDNLVLTDINISPSTIEVKGDNDIVNLTKIVTKPIDINSLLDKKAIEVELDLPDGVTLLNPNDRVTIFYNIEETITKDFVFAPEDIRTLNLNPDFVAEELDPGTEIIVSLRGISSLIDKLSQNNMNVYIDLQNLNEGRHLVDIQISEIQGVVVDNINPKQLTINLNKR